MLTSAAIAALACSWEARGTLLPPNWLYNWVGIEASASAQPSTA
ncbi:Uncharacterised protein [Mycobacteroides abscessus]|nr:Uncharacterised protein [Mycobacteroides abscessus]